MQKDTSVSDQELILKKRARRRLVGAIALVLLMVTVLPMVLQDRSQEKTKDQVKINLPGEVAKVEPVPAPEPEPEQDAASDFDSSVTSGESTQNVQEAQEAAPQESGNESQHTQEVMPPQQAAAEPAPAQKPQPANGKKFYVQVGVFSDAGNVKRLQAKLDELGYASVTEKMNTPAGQKIRLKTKVFADRNEAAIALQNIKDAGLTGMVVSQ